MGIYFGNLDRQLADRQQVLKEDAERQYRGMKDIRQAFGGLGDAATDVIKTEAQMKKLRYDLERQGNYDRMKEQEFNDISLQRDLKNIKDYISVRTEQHTKRQWPKGTPKAVRELYQDRYDQHFKDTTPELYKKILRYRSLYGTKAANDARTYMKLLDPSKNATDEQIEEARLRLEGHAPMTFLKWAESEKFFNPNIKGDPAAHGNKMYVQALINAGYDIPQAEDISNSYMQAGVQNKEGSDSGDNQQSDQQIYLKSIRNNNNSDDQENKIKEPVPNPKVNESEDAGVYVDHITGEKFPLVTTTNNNITNPANRLATTVSPEEQVRINKAEKITTFNENAFRQNRDAYKGNLQSPGHPRNMQIAADNGNTFTIELGNALNEAGISTLPDVKVLTSRDEIKRPPDWVGYKKEGPESTKDDKFFPFMEGIGDEDIEKYRNLPNYATWENVPEAEKKKLQTDPLVIQGANIKEVAEYRKNEQVKQDIDDEILLLHNEIASRIESNPSLNALHGGGITNLSIASQAPRKLEKIKSPYGGKIGTPVEINQLIENYNKRIPILQDDADSLRSSLSTSVPKIKAKKSGRDLRGKASDYGISNTRNPNIAPSWWQNIGTTPIVDIDARELQDIFNEARQTIMDKEGLGIRGEGHAYYDGKTPSKDGNYGKGSENLILAGGNNVYDLIQSIPNKNDREIELQEVAKMLFGEGSGEQSAYGSDRNNKDEFLRYMRMDKDQHKYEYATHEQRGALSLRAKQVETLTGYMMNKNLELLQKKHSYLNDIARYPKEMQLFIMDNAFNMGPGWLEKFDKLEAHLKSWHDSRSDAHLKLIMREYKDSDHFRSKITGARALNNYNRLRSLLKTSTITV
jgi:hypothetical protein